MPTFTDPESIEWYRYPALAENPHGKQWIKSEALLGLAPNTIDAYARGVDDFLAFCQRADVNLLTASKGDLARYVGDLRQRPGPQKTPQDLLGESSHLSNATLQQRITAVRLFFDFLVEEHVREENPVGRGRYTPGKAFGSRQERALIPKWQTLPWIPSDAQWQAFLVATQSESIRTRCMVALAYDAALRREELCSLQSEDVDPAHRLLRLRAETTKGHRLRTVPYSTTSGELLRAYLAHRRTIAQTRGPLFLSESPRNFASPLTLWTWSKVVRQIADRADLPHFSTHTFRHLCLTDLARAGWDLHAIALFAGHRNPQTTLLYIHLSGHDLADRLAQGMEQIHAWRVQTLAHLGIVETPLPKNSGTPVEVFRTQCERGIAPDWVACTERWHQTSVLAPQTRKSMRNSLLKAGRWLALHHPDITRPEQWTRELAAEYVAAVDRMHIGEYVGYTKPVHARQGEPISPRRKAHLLCTMRQCFHDAQEWGWIPRHFNPGRVFATPRSLKALSGPSPRAIADDVWAKLLWAD